MLIKLLSKKKKKEEIKSSLVDSNKQPEWRTILAKHKYLSKLGSNPDSVIHQKCNPG